MFVFGIYYVSSGKMFLTLVYLTWPMDDLVGLWCFRVGVVPSVIPANFYSPIERKPSCKIGFMYASGWGV